MSSLRDRRVRIYRYADAGSAGFASSRYIFSSERWASVVNKTSREGAIGGQPGQTIDGVADVALATDVQYNDLLIDGTTRYFVRGVTDQRNPDARLAKLERIPAEQYQALIVEELPTIANGPVTDAYTDAVAES